MNGIIKKVCYLREDQVARLVDVVFVTHKNGKRTFNESSLCRVAIDLFLSLDLDIKEFSTEEELLQACKALIKKQIGDKE